MCASDGSWAPVAWSIAMREAAGRSALPHNSRHAEQRMERPVAASRLTYLDYNATAPIRPEVASAVAEALAICGNPSSVHRAGRAARRAVEQARREVASLLGAAEEEVVFVSGGGGAHQPAAKGANFRPGLGSAHRHDCVLPPLAPAPLPPPPPA